MSLQPPPTSTTPTPSPRRPQAGALSSQVRSPTVDIASFWLDQPDHDQQSPTARRQLTLLLYRRACGGENANRSGIMAEALLGLAPSSRLEDTHTNKIQIQHPDQIQDHLRRAIEYNVRPTRAEHVSVTFDIRNTVQFTLASADNDTPEVEDPEPDDIETIDYTSNMPVASMVTPAADLSTQDYFNTGSGGLSFPQTNHPDGPVINPSSMTYPAPPPAAEETYSEVHAAVVSLPKPRQTNGRRSLPSGPTQAAPDAEQTQAQVHYASSWQQGASNDTARSASTRSPTLAKQAARQHQQHQQPSPTVQPAQTVTPSQTSPFQVPAQTARAKSRTGQRSQTPHGAQRTSTPSHHTVQQIRSPAAPPPTVAAPNYSAAADLTALSQQNPYSTRYSSAVDQQTAPMRLGIGTSSASTSAQHQHHQSTSLQQFDMRSKGSGHQQSRSQQQQQPYGSYTPQQQQQQQAQTPTSSRQQQGHEQTQSAAQQQQQQNSWYGSFGSGSSSFVPANATPGYGTRSSGSAGYGSGTTGTTSYGQQQHPQQQQHRQQQHHGLSNMPAHGYGGAEGDIFDLLKAGMNSR
ncbi:hypothetical protein HYQ44_020333 [Verticillium longisporum]|nr:hypothetical protein HYQ44_020333 [Verticillium longisporum]